MDVCKYAVQIPIVHTNRHLEEFGKVLSYDVPILSDPLSPKERRPLRRHVKRLHEERQAKLRGVIQRTIEWPWCGVWNRPVDLAFGGNENAGVVIAAWHCRQCGNIVEAGKANTALLRAKERFEEVVKRAGHGTRRFSSLSRTDLCVLLDAGERKWWPMHTTHEAKIRRLLARLETLAPRPTCKRCRCEPAQTKDGLCRNCESLLREIDKHANTLLREGVSIFSDNATATANWKIDFQ